MVSRPGLRSPTGTPLTMRPEPLPTEGTVTKFMWANPHTQIYFDSKDAEASILRRMLKPESRQASQNEVDRKCRKAGTSDDIFSPAKDSTLKGFLQRIVFSDGKQLGMLEHLNGEHSPHQSVLRQDFPPRGDFTDDPRDSVSTKPRSTASSPA